MPKGFSVVAVVVTTVVISNFLVLPLGPKISSTVVLVVISILPKGFYVVVTTVVILVISNFLVLEKRSSS